LTASTDDQEVFANDVYRDGVLLATTSPSELMYHDLTVLPNNTYDYYVVARDAADSMSDPSDTVMVTTPPPPMSITFTPTTMPPSARSGPIATTTRTPSRQIAVR